MRVWHEHAEIWPSCWLCTNTLIYFHFCAIAVQCSEMLAQILTWGCAGVCFQLFHWRFKLISVLCVDAVVHCTSAMCLQRGVRHKWKTACSSLCFLFTCFSSTSWKHRWNTDATKNTILNPEKGRRKVKAAMEWNNKALKTKAFDWRSTLFSLTKLMWLQVLHTLS